MELPLSALLTSMVEMLSSEFADVRLLGESKRSSWSHLRCLLVVRSISPSLLCGLACESLPGRSGRTLMTYTLTYRL